MAPIAALALGRYLAAVEAVFIVLVGEGLKSELLEVKQTLRVQLPVTSDHGKAFHPASQFVRDPVITEADKSRRIRLGTDVARSILNTMVTGKSFSGSAIAPPSDSMHIRKIRLPTLWLAYEESGPERGEPLILVHGWPDSVRTWDRVLPLLHDAGYRTIAPYLRGYGASTFRDPVFGRKTRRTGQPVAFARDIIDLADRLRLQQFHYVGHDWGART